MRTAVGSSKIVARSRVHSSPACDPSGVILTFWAHAVDDARRAARKMAWAGKCFMGPPVNVTIDILEDSRPGGRGYARRAGWACESAARPPSLRRHRRAR